MKKVKVEDYKKPSYSTLKMVTGKVLPAGLVIATMITAVPNTNAQADKTVNSFYNFDETKSFNIMMGDVPETAIEENPVTVMINQEAIDFDVEPILENGIVLVPMRKIFETLGANVSWDDKTKTATARKDGDIITIAVNDMKMTKNGREISFDAATIIVNGRLLVPLKAVSEGLDCNVSWDENNNQVTVDCKEEQDISVIDGGVPIVGN